MTNGQRIRHLRQIAGVSQYALGDAMGVAQITIHDWEIGKLRMADYQFDKAKKALAECVEAKTLSGAKVDTKKTKPEKKGKVETKYCTGCTYWRWLASQAQGGDKCCHYILDNERRRPCPAGKECTEYTKKKQVKKRWNGEMAYLVKGAK